MAEEKEDITDLSNPDVVTKYKAAGDISNAALAEVVKLCKAGARIVDICIAGDLYIDTAVAKIYKGKKVEKGVGFPTSVSPNNLVGHFSPALSDDTPLQVGDLVKLDLGTHVDGFVALVATTVMIGEEGPVMADGKAGDLLAATYTAAELAIRMLKPGLKNTAITEMISAVAEDFGVSAVHGVLSHSMDKNVIDGEKSIICKADVDEKVDEVDFEPNEVYAIDILMSTGEGKPKNLDERTAIFKRNAEEVYQLKMKASRAVLSDITKNHPTFPFAMRQLDSKTAAFGIKECIAHNLVREYPVLMEKPGELVAHVKFTALLMPNGTLKVTGHAAATGITPEQFTTEKALKDPEMIKLLQTSVGKKKKKNNKKKKPKAAAE